MKDFLAITDFKTDEINQIFDRADSMFNHWHNNTMPNTLKHKRIALWSYGNGFRNRVAFEIGAKALGAEISFIPGDLGIHEPLQDIGSYLDNWFDMSIIRCRSHKDLVAFSKDFSGAVINARTDYNHPCEIIGDLQYIRRKRGSIDNLKVLFVGEISNVSRSWLEAANRLPISVTQIAPEEYLLSESEIKEFNKTAVGEIVVSSNLEASINKSVDVIYTDCWPNGEDSSKIEKLFLPYQVNASHLSRMNQNGFFLPCPPVSRDKEVSSDALQSDLCKVYEAKEFLLHSQNAILEHLSNKNSV